MNNPGQPVLPRVQERLGSAGIHRRGDPLPATQFRDRDLAPQSLQYDVDQLVEWLVKNAAAELTTFYCYTILRENLIGYDLSLAILNKENPYPTPLFHADSWGIRCASSERTLL